MTLNAFGNWISANAPPGSNPPNQEQLDEARLILNNLAGHDSNTLNQHIQQNRQKWKDAEKLKDIEVVEIPAKRRLNLTKFKMVYSTLEDFRLRLINTIIYVGCGYYHVRDVVRSPDEVYLIIQNPNGIFRCPFSHPGIDLRSPEPRYIPFNGRACFLVRFPRRQQKQGICNDNCYLKAVGEEQHQAWSNTMKMIQGLEFKGDIIWSETYADLMLNKRVFNNVRLNNRVALYMTDIDRSGNQQIVAEYKGRKLGAIKENVVLLDGSDFEMPWISQDVKAVGLQPRKA